MAFPAPHPIPPARGLGYIGRWEGTQLEQLSPGISQTIRGHVQFINLGRKERKGWGGRGAGGHFADGICQVTVTFDEAQFSWGWLNTQCPWEMHNEFLALFSLCTAFGLPIKPSVPQNRGFSHFYPRNSLPHLSAEGLSEQLCGAELAGVKPRQSKKVLCHRHLQG